MVCGLMERFLTSLPAITTARLRIRRLEPADLSAFHQMTNNPAITDKIHFLQFPFTMEAAASLLRGNEDGMDCFWGIWPRNSMDLAGTIGTHLHGADEIEIGYWFSPAFQGHGYATESVGGILSVLTNTYPTRRIYAECRVENSTSWHLLERLGFQNTSRSGVRPGRLKLIYAPKEERDL